MKDNLLIISCSGRKKNIEGKISAWELYDGVFYRTLKKNNVDFDKFDIVIISAKYGLIFPDTKIELYDQLMTKERAEELKEQVSLDLFDFLETRETYLNTYICLGKNYMKTIEKIIKGVPFMKLNIIEGGIAVKLGKIKKIIINSNINSKGIL
jgi:hypothetical protein